MSASWTAGIIFTSGARGLEIHISPSKITPEVIQEKTEGFIGHNIHELAFKNLQDELPKVIDFHAMVSELKASFEGCWNGLHMHSRELMVTHPVFNKKGDLLLELGVRSTEAAAAAANGHGNGHLVVQSNGYANGHVNGSNGHANGHVNGSANGSANGHENEYWFRHGMHSPISVHA